MTEGLLPWHADVIREICRRLKELNDEYVVSRKAGGIKTSFHYTVTPRAEAEAELKQRMRNNRRRKLWREE